MREDRVDPMFDFEGFPRGIPCASESLRRRPERRWVDGVSTCISSSRGTGFGGMLLTLRSVRASEGHGGITGMMG